MASESSHAATSRRSLLKLEFAADRSFEADLRQRVNAYFEQDGGRSRAGAWPLYVQTAVILGCAAACYALLVFVARSVWVGLPLVILLGFATAAIGFCIGHDAGHKAYARTPWVNQLMALSMDLVGASSYVWFWKHAVIHHRFVNIAGYDTDIDLGILGRLSPHKKRLAFYRWQHLYLWPLYGLLAIKWQWVDDFRNVIAGRIGRHGIPRPTGWNLAAFIGGKAAFFTWALALPMLFHPVGVVLFYYAIGALVLGMTLSVVFQLPHCVAQAEFVIPGEEAGRIDTPWAAHQARATLDFARRSAMVSWPLGGLNFHREHHLFPTICHIHYPAITKIVEDACREHGLGYEEHATFRAGIAAHYRWLRRMGMPERQEGQAPGLLSR